MNENKLRWDPEWDKPFLKYLAQKGEKPLPNFGKVMTYQQAFPDGRKFAVVRSERDKCPYCQAVFSVWLPIDLERIVAFAIVPVDCTGSVAGDGDRCVGLAIKKVQVVKDCCRECGGGFLRMEYDDVDPKESGLAAILMNTRCPCCNQPIKYVSSKVVWNSMAVRCDFAADRNDKLWYCLNCDWRAVSSALPQQGPSDLSKPLILEIQQTDGKETIMCAGSHGQTAGTCSDGASEVRKPRLCPQCQTALVVGEKSEVVNCGVHETPDAKDKILKCPSPGCGYWRRAE